MSKSSELVDALVARWIELEDAGHPEPFAEACAEHPDLEPQVRERLAALRRLGLLSVPAVETPRAPGTMPAAPAGEQTLAAMTSARGMADVKLRDPESGRDIRSELEADCGVRRLGKYLVGERIGRGGVGDVTRGCDLELNREVAIKFLREELQRNEDVLRRFVEEVQIGAQLQHPGIVPVYDLELGDGRPFFAMKPDPRSDPAAAARGAA